MYAFLGLSAIVFIIHGIVLYGWETQRKRMSLDRMGLMAVLNLVGACTYAGRVSQIVFSGHRMCLKTDRYEDPGKMVSAQVRHRGL